MAHARTRAHPVGADAGDDTDADPTRVSRRHGRVRAQAVARMHVHDAVAADTVEVDKERAEAEKRKRAAVPSGAAAAGDEEGSARGRLKKKQRVGARRRSATRKWKNWTEGEDASLVEHCKHGVPPSKIVIPNRTVRSIQQRLQTLRKEAAALGDSLDEDIAAALAKKCVKWTAEEDASLLVQSKRGVRRSNIVIPNRTTRAVETRLSTLRNQAAATGAGVDEDIMAALARRQVHVRWTAAEDASLLEQRKRGVATSKIVIPNRTAFATVKRLQNLRKQAAALGDKLDDSVAAALAKKKVKWTAAEDASLLQQHERGVPPSKLVIPNRTTSSINNRLYDLRKQAAALGDKLDDSIAEVLAKKRVTWTAAEDASLLEQHQCGVTIRKIVIPNRTPASIQNRLQTLRKHAAALGDKLDNGIAAALTKKRVKWTAAEDASLLEQHKRGVPLVKIVIPNRTAFAINACLRRLHK